jgi:hypothetical protein
MDFGSITGGSIPPAPIRNRDHSLLVKQRPFKPLSEVRFLVVSHPTLFLLLFARSLIG